MEDNNKVPRTRGRPLKYKTNEEFGIAMKEYQKKYRNNHLEKMKSYQSKYRQKQRQKKYDGVI